MMIALGIALWFGSHLFMMVIPFCLGYLLGNSREDDNA